MSAAGEGGYPFGRRIAAGRRSVFTEDPIAAIVVGDLYRKGEPLREQPFVKQWRRASGAVYSTLVVEPAIDHVRAVVSELRPGEEIASWEQIISVLWTPVNYGGERPIFACPECGTPVRTLYMHRALDLRCRRCADLRYASKSRSSYGSVAEQARRIRQRLGGPTLPSAPLPLKPPRMHERTYQRLIGELRELEVLLFPPAEPDDPLQVLREWERQMKAARRAEQEFGAG